MADQVDGGNGRILTSIFFPRLEWTEVEGDCQYCGEWQDHRVRIRPGDMMRAGFWICEQCLAREWFDEA